MALCLGGGGSAHLLRGLVAHGASAAVHAHQVASGGQGVHVGLDVIHSQPAIKGALVGGQHLAWRHAWGASEGCTLDDVQHLLLDGLWLGGCGHIGLLRIRKNQEEKRAESAGLIWPTACPLPPSTARR